MNDFLAILLIIIVVIGFIILITAATVKIQDAIEEAAEYHRKINE